MQLQNEVHNVGTIPPPRQPARDERFQNKNENKNGSTIATRKKTNYVCIVNSRSVQAVKGAVYSQHLCRAESKL